VSIGHLLPYYPLLREVGYGQENMETPFLKRGGVFVWLGSKGKGVSQRQQNLEGSRSWKKKRAK
jgi:hypothetical protein